MAVAVFSYAAWAARYPALAATVSSDTATAIFTDATLTLLDNTDCSPVQDVNTRLALLNMLVAHIAVLDARSASAGGAGAAMVGNVASAGEGSVNVSMAAYPVGSGKWYEQTQYGAQYWNSIQAFIRARYIPGRRAYTGVPRYGGL